MTIFNNVGNDVEGATSVAQVIEQAGLNFNVEKRPIFTKDGRKEIEIPGLVSTVRTDTNEPLGVVSPKYEIFQNNEAFDFVDYIGDGLTYRKAGMLNNGMVFIIGELPQMNVMGDEFKNYVIFRNSFNKKFPLQATISPMRIVCENQFNRIFSNDENQIRIVHSSNLESKVSQAKIILKNYEESMHVLKDKVEKFAARKFDFEKYTEYIYPTTDNMNDKVVEQQIERRATLVKAYNRDDNANFSNTFLGAINATTYIDSHYEGCASVEGNIVRMLDKPTFTSKLMEFARV